MGPINAVAYRFVDDFAAAGFHLRPRVGNSAANSSPPRRQVRQRSAFLLSCHSRSHSLHNARTNNGRLIRFADPSVSALPPALVKARYADIEPEENDSFSLSLSGAGPADSMTIIRAGRGCSEYCCAPDQRRNG